MTSGMSPGGTGKHSLSLRDLKGGNPFEIPGYIRYNVSL